MEADPLFKTLTEYEGVGIILEWNSGLRIVGETDHGLADDDPAYVEYYATAFQVKHILSHPSTSEGGVYNWLKFLSMMIHPVQCF